MNNKGTILALSMLIITAIILFGTALVMLTQTNVITSRREKSEKQALYVAEAGIERTMYALNLDNDWSDVTPADNLYTNESLQYSVSGVTFTGTYTVVLSGRSVDDLIVTSTGTVDNESRQLRVRVSR